MRMALGAFSPAPTLPANGQVAHLFPIFRDKLCSLVDYTLAARAGCLILPDSPGRVGSFCSRLFLYAGTDVARPLANVPGSTGAPGGIRTPDPLLRRVNRPIPKPRPALLFCDLQNRLTQERGRFCSQIAPNFLDAFLALQKLVFESCCHQSSAPASACIAEDSRPAAKRMAE